MHKQRSKPTGFTIVELLIVIVVIGILAAITIVVYIGVQQRASIASLDSDLEGAAKQFGIDNAANSGYPTTVAAANNGQGLKSSAGNSFSTYTVNNSSSPQTFCLSETNTSGVSYYITGTNNIPTTGSCTITSGLVGWWSFNGNANDISGNGNNATTNNATLTTGQNGSSNAAYAFNGFSGGIITPSINTLGNSFTGTSWFKTTTPGDMKIISTSSNDHILQLFTGGQLRICVNGCTVAAANLADGNWHFVVAEGDATSIRGYVDGVSTPVITQTALGASQIGGNYYLGQDHLGAYIFNGSIDDVRSYNRALSTAEIQSLYNAGAQ